MKRKQLRKFRKRKRERHCVGGKEAKKSIMKENYLKGERMRREGKVLLKKKKKEKYETEGERREQ